MASRDIKDCHPLLQEAWPKLKQWFERDNPGSFLKLTTTYRSPEEQNGLYQIGRTVELNRGVVTYIDGYSRKSNHNYQPALAFDVGVFKDVDGDGDLEYITEAQAYMFRDYVKLLGLRWGGDWQKFKDRPHFEVPVAIKMEADRLEQESAGEG